MNSKGNAGSRPSTPSSIPAQNTVATSKSAQIRSGFELKDREKLNQQQNTSEQQRINFELAGLNQTQRLAEYEKMCQGLKSLSKYKTTHGDVKKMYIEMLGDLRRVYESAERNSEGADRRPSSSDEQSGTPQDEGEKEELELMLVEKNELLRRANEELQKATKELESMKKRLNIAEQSESNKFVSELTTKMDETNDKLKNMIKEREQQLDELKKSAGKSNDVIKKQKEEIACMMAKQSDLNNAIEEKNKAIDEMTTELAALNSQIDKAKGNPGDSVAGGAYAYSQWPSLPKSKHQTVNQSEPRSMDAGRWLQNNVHVKTGCRSNALNRAIQNRPSNDRSSTRERVHLIAVNKRPTGLLSEDELQARTKDLMRPLRKEIRFADIYQNKKGKTIIKYHRKEDGDKILEALSKIELEAEYWRVGEKRRLIIKNIPNHLTKAQIIEDLAAENGIAVREDQVRQLSGSAFSSQRAILTMNEDEAKGILDRTDRVVIEFKTCRIERDLKPLQCFVCGGFNHSAYKFGKLVCTNKPSCSKCGVETEQPRCPNHQCESNRTKCSNCKATDHSASSKDCPIYQKILRELSDRW